MDGIRRKLTDKIQDDEQIIATFTQLPREKRIYSLFQMFCSWTDPLPSSG
jgi:hypothetical protein